MLFAVVVGKTIVVGLVFVDAPVPAVAAAAVAASSKLAKVVGDREIVVVLTAKLHDGDKLFKVTKLVADEVRNCCGI
jgi:hypothetical protein